MPCIPVRYFPGIYLSSFEAELQEAQQFFSWFVSFFGGLWTFMTAHPKLMLVVALIILSAVAALFIRLRHIRG